MSKDGYTIKEMVSKVLDQNEKALVTQTQILQHAQNVDEHLDRLNSKVALHEEKIGILSNEHTKFKAISATLWSVLGFIWAGFTFLWK